MKVFNGSKLKSLREKRGLTQGELGKLVGKKTADISNYENGFATPPFPVLMELTSFFSIEARELSKTLKAEVVAR